MSKSVLRGVELTMLSVYGKAYELTQLHSPTGIFQSFDLQRKAQRRLKRFMKGFELTATCTAGKSVKLHRLTKVCQSFDPSALSQATSTKSLTGFSAQLSAYLVTQRTCCQSLMSLRWSDHSVQEWSDQSCAEWLAACSFEFLEFGHVYPWGLCQLK